VSSVRNRIEDGFGWWAEEVVRWRWLIIGASLLAALCLASRIPLLDIETSTEDYLLDSDPAKIAYDAFRRQFGRDQPLLILIEPEEVFDFDFLEELVALHRELEDTVVHLAEVTSLYNVRSVFGDGDRLLVDDLLEVMPHSDAQLAQLKARVLGTPSYRNSMISADGRVVVVIVEANAYSSEAQAGAVLGGFDDFGDEGERPLLTGAENSEFCESVLAVVERHRRDGLEIHLTGQPLIAFALTRSMKADFPKIFGAALALICTLIALLFRRLFPVLLAALIVILSLVSTLGISQLIGIPVGLPTQVLPTFLLAVGVGYAVHLMTIFFRTLGERPDRATSLDITLRHVGVPILMTGVTTAAGLLSFVAAEMDQVMDLGILGAIGVMVTQVYALILLPALLAVLPFRVSSAQGLSGGNLFLTVCARTSIRHPKSIVAGALVLALGSLVLLPGLDYSANPIEYFPEDHWLRRATLFADDRIEGMQSLEILVDTEGENRLHEPEVLVAVEGLRTLVAELVSEGEKVGPTNSILEVVKETHQALNENRSEFYALPTERRVIAQELLLFENSGSDDLDDLVDSQFSKARFNVRTDGRAGRGRADGRRRLDRANRLGDLQQLATQLQLGAGLDHAAHDVADRQLASGAREHGAKPGADPRDSRADGLPGDRTRHVHDVGWLHRNRARGGRQHSFHRVLPTLSGANRRPRESRRNDDADDGPGAALHLGDSGGGLRRAQPVFDGESRKSWLHDRLGHRLGLRARRDGDASAAGADPPR